MSEKALTKVGIVGIGDIAQKAYLPVLCAIPGIEVIPCSRNADVVKNVMSKYHLRVGMTDLKDLIDEKPDMIFLCSATSAHIAMATQILQAKIPLHLDKPVSYTYEETKALFELAKAKKTRLMIGFNRRYVPSLKDIAKQGAPDLVVIQKNRIIPQGEEPRHMIFDDYIHVIDTCLYLLGEPCLKVSASNTVKNGKQSMVVTHFYGAHAQAIGIMNYDNGITEEVIEVMRHGEKKIVRSLETLEVCTDDVHQVKTQSTWIPTLQKRGFEAMITHFINAVQNGTPFDFPLDLALRSHELAEEILRQVTSA